MFDDFDLISAKEMRNRQEGLKDRDEIVKKIIKRLRRENIWKIIRGGIIMSNVSISFEEMKNDLLKDNEFKTEYEKLKPRYEAIEQIIKARKEQNMTQAELAKRVGTQKSNISRLESGNYNPSLDFLTKVSEALGKSLSVQLMWWYEIYKDKHKVFGE